jgi:glucose/arabinose dehydrogenase
VQRVLRNGLFLTIVFLVSATAAHAAQSFVYVSENGCNGSLACDRGNIGVYDAATGGLVAQIAVPMSVFGGDLAISPDGRRLYVNLGQPTMSVHPLAGRSCMSSPAVRWRSAVTGGGSSLPVAA